MCLEENKTQAGYSCCPFVTEAKSTPSLAGLARRTCYGLQGYYICSKIEECKGQQRLKLRMRKGSVPDPARIDSSLHYSVSS